MKVKNKFIASLLACSMIVTSLSTTTPTFADEPDTTVVDTIETNGDDSTTEVQVLTQEELDKLIADGEVSTEDIVSVDETTNSTDTSEEDITEEVTEEITSEEVSEENTEEVTSEENSEEETSEEVSEDTEEATSEEETTETTERVRNFIENRDGSTGAISFESRELLIGTEDPSIFTWDTEVLSEYNDVYLVRFETVQETRNAYIYYSEIADFVSANITFTVSDEESVKEEDNSNKEETSDNVAETKDEENKEKENNSDENSLTADLSTINQNDDALSNLNDMDIDTVPDKTIALIDTGVDSIGLIDSVSVIGDDVSDENGHGTKMYNYIREEAPNAKIISIKALDANGKGKASDIYAAIQYAIEAKVDIINLSFSAFSTEENSIIIQTIEDAVDKGIIVVGAAGNDNQNAKYFIPGCIEKAVIVGAYNKNQSVNSNYGKTVDYYIDNATSTSEATARMAGLIAIGDINNEKILQNFDNTEDNNYSDIDKYNSNSDFSIDDTSIIKKDGYKYEVDNLFGVKGYLNGDAGYVYSKFFDETIDDTWLGNRDMPSTVSWGDPGTLAIGNFIKFHLTDYYNTKGTFQTSGTYAPMAFCSDASNKNDPVINGTKNVSRTTEDYSRTIGRWIYNSTNHTLTIPFYTYGITTAKTGKPQLAGFYVYVTYTGTQDVTYKYYYAAVKKVNPLNDYSAIDGVNFSVYIGGTDNSNYVGKVTSGHYGGYNAGSLTGWTATKWDDDGYAPGSGSGIALMYIGKYESTANKPTVYVQEDTAPNGYGKPDTVGYNSPWQITVFEGTSAGAAVSGTGISTNTQGGVPSAKAWAAEKANTYKNTPLPYWIKLKKDPAQTVTNQPSMVGITYGLYATGALHQYDSSLNSGDLIATYTLAKDGTVASVAINKTSSTKFQFIKEDAYPTWVKIQPKTLTNRDVNGTSVVGGTYLPHTWFYIQEIASNDYYKLNTKWSYIGTSGIAADGSRTLNQNFTIAATEGGSAPADVLKDELVDYTYYTTMKKNSDTTDLTNYPLTNIQYGLYDSNTSNAESNRIGTVTLNASGYPTSLELNTSYSGKENWSKESTKVSNTTVYHFKYTGLSSTAPTCYWREISTNDYYLINTTPFSATFATTASAIDTATFTNSTSNNTTNYHYVPYFVAVKKFYQDKSSNSPVLQNNIQFTLTISSTEKYYAKTGDGTSPDGIAVFEIPSSEHYTENNKPANGTITESVPSGTKPDKESITVTEYFTTKDDAIASLSGTFTNYELYPYYAKLIKEDKHGNWLEGVPFRYKIENGDWKYDKTDANGEIVAETGSTYTKQDTAPTIKWEELSWGDNVIYLHNGHTSSKTKITNNDDYIVNSNIPIQTMSNVSAESAKYTHENEKYQHYDVSIKKTSLGELTNVDMSGTIYEIGVLNGTKFTSIGEFTLKKDGTPSKFDTVGTVSDGVTIEQLTHNSVVYAHISVPETDSDNIAIIEGTGTKQLAIREKQANDNHEKNTKTSSFSLVENSDEQHYKVLDYENYEALGDNQKISLIFNIKKSPKAGSQSLSMEGVQYGVFTTENASSNSKIATFKMGADGTVSEVTPNKTSVGGFTIGTDETHKYLTISIADGNTTPIIQRITTGLYIQETQGNKFYEKNDEVIPINMEDLTVNQEVTLQPSKYGILYEEARVPVYAALIKYVTDPTKDLKDNPLNGVPFDITVKNGTNTVFTANASGTPDAPTSGVWTGYLYDAVKGQYYDIKEHANNGTAQTGNVVFTLTVKDGTTISNVQTSTNQDVTQNITRKDGLAVVYLGLIKESNLPKYTVNITENWNTLNNVAYAVKKVNSEITMVSEQGTDFKNMWSGNITLKTNGIPENPEKVTNRSSSVKVKIVKTPKVENDSQLQKILNNPNYSLDGATYAIYRKNGNAYTKVKDVVLTESNDKRSAMAIYDISDDFFANDNINPVTYYIREEKGGHNYSINNPTTNGGYYTLTVTKPDDDENEKIFTLEEVSDPVEEDPVQFTISKRHKQSNKPVRPEHGDDDAIIKLSYYNMEVVDNKITSTDLPTNPTSTENITLTWNEETKTYEQTSILTFYQMGYLTISEIEPPTGYKKDGNIININIGSKTYSWKYPDTPVFVFKRITDGDTTLTNPDANIGLFVWTDDGLQRITAYTSADINFKVDFLEETEITPTFGSNAITTTTNSQLGVIANSTTIKDTIWCKDVQNGNTYTYRASLYDITDSNDITKLTALKTVSYTYESTGRAEQEVLKNGETPFVFNINSSGLAGHTLAVAVEVIGDGNEVWYTHNTDFSDTNQMIYYPSITTVANGVNTTKVGKIATNDVITDKISYSNFPVGTKIKLKGQLIDLNESATSNNRIAGTYTSPSDITVTKDDTTTISYTVDSTKRKGHKLTSVVTAFITTPDGTVDVITHNSAMNIADETVYYPNTRSELTTSNGTQMGVLKANETARERVYFSNIPQGTTVTVSAELYDITNGTPSQICDTLTEQKESNGLSEQYVDLTFNYNATQFAGKTLTAVAKINIGNNPVISHNTDYSEVTETIYYPTFDTDLLSSSTGSKLASISTNEFATDKVTFKNVPQGIKLTFVGELVNMETNTKITLKNGDATDKTQVTYTMPNGSTGLDEQTVEIPFNYDATGLEGIALSARTYVKLGNTQITVHNNNLTDTNEQIRYMAFNTKLLSKYPNNTTHKVGIVNKTETESEYAVDTVTFKGVPAGTVVTYYAELRDKTANNSLVTLKNDTTDGTKDNILVVNAPASTGITSQSFDITFEYNSKNLAGHTLSAKVTAMLNGKVVGVHNEDLTDEEETIYYLSGQTSAADVKTTTKLGSKTSTTKIYDDFTFTNAVKGVHYTMTGTVHKRTKDGKDDGPLMNGTTPITKTVEFWIGDDNKIHTTNADQDNSSATMTSDTTASGKVRVIFDIDTRLLQNVTTTVFEDITVDGIEVFVHENINDKDQQVHFMELATDIENLATATNIGALVEQEVVQDRLKFENVPFGTVVKFDGVLKYKDGTNVGLDGTTSSVTLTVGNMGSVSTSSGVQTEVNGVSDRNTNTVSGTIILTYKYNSTTLANKTLVSCVTATHNGETVDLHTDLNDERETIYYPSVHTNANDANTLTNVAKLGLTQIIDTVTVNNLALGHTYKVSGSLHKKNGAQTKIGETKEATIAINADGSVITVDGKPVTTLKVTNKAVNGTIDIIFDIDTSTLLGEDVVVFEDLYYGATKLADHADINDEGQTVHIPDGGTTAMDGQTQDHVGTVLENGTIQLPDTVHLTNIACGHTYYLEGVLMDKATGESLKVGENNAEVKANATFTVSADGKTVTPKNTANKVTNLQDGEHANTVSFDIVLNFEVASKELHDKDIVVFEKGYFVKSATENVEIFKEENIDDLGQTVHFPGVKTLATDDTYKDHVGITSETEAITEKSILTNLVFGMEYEVTATVMNQITNQPIMNGSTPVSKTAVVKTREDGTIEYVKVKDTDTTLEYKVTAKRTNTYDITIDIPIVFNSIGANGSSIVLFEDLKHNNVIVKSHHELEDTDEQIHYFELILYKEGLDNPTIAEFKIEQNNTQMKFKALTDGSYAIASDGTLNTLHPNTNGVIVIRGFNADPYTITEIKTASGKNMLTQPVNVQFVSDTSDADNIIRGLKVSMKDEKGREYTAIINPTDETKPYSIELNVTNNDSIKLMTGGHGTYMFYFFGLTLLIFAMGIFMIYRRKRH